MSTENCTMTGEGQIHVSGNNNRYLVDNEIIAVVYFIIQYNEIQLLISFSYKRLSQFPRDWSRRGTRAADGEVRQRHHAKPAVLAHW